MHSMQLEEYAKLSPPIIGISAPNGRTVVGAIQFPHPGDKHCWIVLAMGERDWVVWDYNAQTGGFANGQYPGEDCNRAYTVFAERLARRVQSAFGLNERFEKWGTKN